MDSSNGAEMSYKPDFCLHTKVLSTTKDVGYVVVKVCLSHSTFDPLLDYLTQTAFSCMSKRNATLNCVCLLNITFIFWLLMKSCTIRGIDFMMV